MTWYKYIVFIFSVGLLSSCISGRSSLQKTEVAPRSYFPYDLSEGVVSSLAPELKEVSGLCFDVESGNIGAVQDEEGVLYTLDRISGEILRRDTFYKAGDYEGLALGEDYIYVVKSSGTIYQINKSDVTAKPTKIKSFLTKEFDVEGMEYDRVENVLLLCLKNYTSEETKNQRFVYRYDLIENKMSEEVYLTIDRAEILTFLKGNFSAEYIADKFKKISNPDLDYLHFGPSAIAIHPVTRDLYILSSQSKVLLIYDGETKKLSYVQKLDKAIFEQPEGICFDTNSNMYISSEGKKKAARLIVVPLQSSKIKTK